MNGQHKLSITGRSSLSWQQEARSARAEVGPPTGGPSAAMRSLSPRKRKALGSAENVRKTARDLSARFGDIIIILGPMWPDYDNVAGFANSMKVTLMILHGGA